MVKLSGDCLCLAGTSRAGCRAGSRGIACVVVWGCAGVGVGRTRWFGGLKGCGFGAGALGSFEVGVGDLGWVMHCVADAWLRLCWTLDYCWS